MGSVKIFWKNNVQEQIVSETSPVMLDGSLQILLNLTWV